MIIFAYSPIGLNQKLMGTVEIRVPSATGSAKNIKHDYKCMTQTWGEREINATSCSVLQSMSHVVRGISIQQFVHPKI